MLAACMGVTVREAAAALPIPEDNTLTYRLVRHGAEIGRHTVIFNQRGEGLSVRIAVDALVTFLSIPIVRYTHRAEETWHANSLVGLKSETNKNGDREWAQAHRTAQAWSWSGARPVNMWRRHQHWERAIGIGKCSMDR